MMFLWMRVDASMCLSLVMASVMAAWGFWGLIFWMAGRRSVS